MNIVANTVQPHGTPRNGLLTRYPLLLYFILAYAGSWLLVVVSAALFAGPFLAGFIVTGKSRALANRFLASGTSVVFALIGILFCPVFSGACPFGADVFKPGWRGFAPAQSILWSAGRNAHPGTASRVMAPAVLLYSGMGHRTGHDS